jgi:glycine/D-amino acid oxidase-like deaminating enzyme
VLARCSLVSWAVAFHPLHQRLPVRGLIPTIRHASLLLHNPEIDGAAQVSDAGEITVVQSAVENVLEAGRALYPGIRAASIESVRVGERPIPGDGLPVLGRVAELRNFHFAVLHSGATLSVHAGDLVAAETLGEERNDTLAPFRFERL